MRDTRKIRNESSNWLAVIHSAATSLDRPGKSNEPKNIKKTEKIRNHYPYVTRIKRKQSLIQRSLKTAKKLYRLCTKISDKQQFAGKKNSASSHTFTHELADREIKANMIDIYKPLDL